MAIAVIGGLLVSTVLSLLFVPAFFSVTQSAGGFLSRHLGPLLNPAGERRADAPRAGAREGALSTGARDGTLRAGARDEPLAGE